MDFHLIPYETLTKILKKMSFPDLVKLLKTGSVLKDLIEGPFWNIFVKKNNNFLIDLQVALEEEVEIFNMDVSELNDKILLVKKRLERENAKAKPNRTRIKELSEELVELTEEWSKATDKFFEKSVALYAIDDLSDKYLE